MHMNRARSALVIKSPDPIPCTDDTGTVTVTVGAGLQPTFNWEPACALAFLLVEHQGEDQWGIGSDPPGTLDPGEADQVNLITPPVTYGTTPSGVDELQPPETLLAGVTYELVLSRVPPGSTADRLGVTFDMCQMATHEFTP